MTPQTRPDSSYSKSYMTRRYSGGAPLSQVNGKPTKRNSRGVEKPSKVKEEPSTSDEPQSSSDDLDTEMGSRGDVDSEKENLPVAEKMTLEEKMGMGVEEEEGVSGSEPVSRSQGSRGKGAKREAGSSRSRGMRMVDITDGGSGDDMSQFTSQAQSQSRKKGVTYGSGSRMPSSSMGQKRPSPSSEDPMSTSSSRKSKKGKDGAGFKVPREIEYDSPPPQAKTRRTRRGQDVKGESESPNSEFKVPIGIDWSSSLAASSAKDTRMFDFDTGDSSLSSPLSSASSGFLNELSQVEEALKPKPVLALCPMCREEVDPESLIRFQSQPRQRVRDQARFCESHKQTTAEKEWREKGYPSIDWEAFDERIAGHFADLEKLLVPENNSYYRNILDTALKSGKGKNLRLTLSGDALETISCGYYGTRGGSKMYSSFGSFGYFMLMCLDCKL